MSASVTGGRRAGIAGFHGVGDEPLLRALGTALARRGATEEVGLYAGAGAVARGGTVLVAPDGVVVAAAGIAAEDVHARYVAGGADAFAALAGPYAVAVVDPRTDALVLARDAAGEAGLYFAGVEGRVVFASEPAALAEAGVVLAPDTDRVLRYVLTGGSDDGEGTFFAGVRQVPPGRVVVIDGAGVATRPLAGAVAADPFAAVRSRLVTAERPAVRLGGGLPGAALAATVQAATDRGAAVFSASFAPLDTTEDLYTGAVGAALETTVHTARVNADTLVADLPAFLRVQGEPFADLGAYVQYAVAKTAAEAGSDVLLDPAGAAETYGLPTGQGGRARRPLDPATLVKPELLADGGFVALGTEGRVAEVRRTAERTAAALGIDVAVPFAGAAGDEAALRDALPEGAPGDVRPAAPVRDWLLRLKNRIYGTFLAESFVSRPWFAQQAVLVAFEDFIKGRNADAELFWRIWCVELWAQEFFDEKPVDEPVRVKGPLEPNVGKKLEIAVGDQTWLRFPIRTELFTSGDPYVERISVDVREFVHHALDNPAYAKRLSRQWYLLVSEKVIAISQGRSYFIWDIEPSWWARTLAKFVVKTPYGIGLGSPWTMELAIKEAGLPRILFAAGVSAAGKALGRRGLFYQVAGHSVRAIDGPTEYSVYPANVSAKLAPAHPAEVAAELRQALALVLKAEGLVEVAEALAGVVVIDANDIGRNVLGADADRPARFFEELFADNPLGQGSEQTPLAVAVAAS